MKFGTAGEIASENERRTKTIQSGEQHLLNVGVSNIEATQVHCLFFFFLFLFLCAA